MTEATARVPALRGIWLLTRLRLIRLLNQSAIFFTRRIGARKGRPASPGKKRNRWLVTALVSLAMLYSFGSMTRQGVINLHQALDAPSVKVSSTVAARSASRYARPPDFKVGVFSAALTRGLTMELSLLFAVAVLVSLGAREMAQPDWDLEWLATLPAPMRTLLWSRIVERSIANPVGLLALGPVCVLLAWYSGYRWSAPLLGAAAALCLLLLAALARTLVDTGLRLSLAPPKLRNLQALISIAGVLLVYLAMSAGMPAMGTTGLAFDLARDFPAWAVWTPTGLVVQAINASGPWDRALLPAVLLVAETAIALHVGISLLQYLLRNGVVAAGSREAARGAAGRRSSTLDESGFRFGGIVQRRELKLLGRDRNFLVQSLVLPVIIVGSQLALNGKLSNLSLAAFSSTTVASIAFALAAYALMLSAFQTLNSEGGALWMLYTVPHRIATILYEKAQLWSVLTLIYPIAVFGIAIALGHPVDVELVGLAAIVLLGVPIFAVIAASLGVFGCDPLAQDVRTRLRPTYVYLYTLLAALYTYAIYASQWSQKIVLIVLSALLALALWQKAEDELPYLLDPSAAPSSRVSLADGLIAAMMFFVFQGLGGALASQDEEALTASQMIVVFSAAGALTYALVRFTYWRSKTAAVPAIFGPGRQVGRALLWGAGAGAVAALAAVVYLHALHRLELQDVLQQPNAGLSRSAWLAVLAVAAAPLFEEFIFRGLIFGGLSRSTTPARAIAASAVLFAIVHPPVSMFPVFIVGLCTAFVYHRSRMLLAPMVTHATYNGVLIGIQFVQP